MSDFTTHYITAKRAEKEMDLSPEEMRGMLFGVEGPDYLFYASIFTRSEETNFGYQFHNYTPKKFFEKCFCDLKDVKNPNYLQKRGYILGQLLHYFGDTTIHPYISYLEDNKNATGFKYIHMQNESEIDLLLYEYEFGTSINDFNPLKEFKFDKNLQQAIFEVWQNQDVQPISKKVIKTGSKRLALSGKIFNMNKFKWLLKLVEPKSAEGFFMCHYKDDRNEAVMNFERAEWDFEGRVSNMSIPDIIDTTMEKFYAEMEKINACLASGEEYIFQHNQDYGGSVNEKVI
ncbi:MAG: zinc dependent phospholipase C family protein [Bacillota bacterium]